MLGSVKKAVFRVLCLGALCLCGGLMAEQDPKELIFSGITIYTDKNFTRAKKYFEKACKSNDADGCAILREAYSKAIARENARESIEKALEHTATAKACKSNDADGCAILREAYSKAIARENARESIEKALEHTATAKACKSNDAEKCRDLAEFYFNVNDLKNALEYYSKSCKLNNVEGCMLSATFYNDMIKGLKKDKINIF